MISDPRVTSQPCACASVLAIGSNHKDTNTATVCHHFPFSAFSKPVAEFDVRTGNLLVFRLTRAMFPLPLRNQPYLRKGERRSATCARSRQAHPSRIPHRPLLPAGRGSSRRGGGGGRGRRSTGGSRGGARSRRRRG
jgi:uncharacterized membrane protein YgcG